MTTMTQQSEPKPSYTKSLIQHLKDNDVDDSVIQQINKFSSKWALKMEKEIKNKPEKDSSVIHWGKYKGRKVNDIVGFDDDYLQWLLKGKYISESQRAFITSALA